MRLVMMYLVPYDLPQQSYQQADQDPTSQQEEYYPSCSQVRKGSKLICRFELHDRARLLVSLVNSFPDF